MYVCTTTDTLPISYTHAVTNVTLGVNYEHHKRYWYVPL